MEVPDGEQSAMNAENYEDELKTLFTGGFAGNVAMLAERSKDIIGKNLYNNVKYDSLFIKWA